MPNIGKPILFDHNPCNREDWWQEGRYEESIHRILDVSGLWPMLQQIWNDDNIKIFWEGAQIKHFPYVLIPDPAISLTCVN